MHRDRYGLELTTHSSAARDAYVEAVDRILSANGGADETIGQALGADPDFALAHAARARWLQLVGRIPEARAAAARATELAAGTSSREQQHVAIFARLVDGRGQEALQLIRTHIAAFPLDAFALSPACGVFGLIGFSGRIDREAEQRDLLEPLARRYGDDWWFLTAYAFALVETGRWARGRELIELALEAHPRNAHAAHVLCHALYEAGEDRAGAEYVASWLPEYSPEGQLHCHLWWHLCLFRLHLGDADAMWAAYDRACDPGVSRSPPINVATDGVSLLWRAELAGVPRSPERWRAIREYVERSFPTPMVFVDVHRAVALAACGDGDTLARYLECLERMGRDGRLPDGTVPAVIGSAFGSFARGDWSDAAARLEAVAEEVVRIGGSRAQRDLVMYTLLAAYVNDGREEAARGLLAARRDRQPTVPVAGLSGNGG